MSSSELSKSKQIKLFKKQKRAVFIITSETGIKSSVDPTLIIGICNAGLTTGIDELVLLEEANKFGKVAELVMLPNKSYCFLGCTDISNSISIYNGLHGKSKIGQNGAVIYLAFFESLPPNKLEENFNSKIRPNGLIILEDFITENEELILLEAIKTNFSEYVPEKTLKNRQVKHYGYEFIYGSNNVNINNPLSSKIPNECNILWPRMKKMNPEFNFWEPDQLTVNKYSPGQGIPAHVDTHSAFLDPIVSLSLESDIVMEFKNKFQDAFQIHLPRRSLLIMSGESRYDWTHAIKPRVYDIIPSKSKDLTVQRRSRRTSLTFRQLRKSECNCNYFEFCDSVNKIKKSICSSTAIKLESENVHKVYNEIANHFSKTRHSPWPKVQCFLNEFTEGSIILDIGCGNGKYLTQIDNTIKIGCDRSDGLLKVCRERRLNTFQCDCLNIPFRDQTVDGCISIAVIHHLATEQRRLQAVIEMARILKSNGRGLIYVWAKNQEVDSKKSSYLKKGTNKESVVENLDRNNFPQVEFDLPVHTNRTQFVQQDIYVPWKLKSDCPNTFLRYYHVFNENELENLCRNLNTIEIIETYYDQGNWCIIFKKL